MRVYIKKFVNRTELSGMKSLLVKLGVILIGLAIFGNAEAGGRIRNFIVTMRILLVIAIRRA